MRRASIRLWLAAIAAASFVTTADAQRRGRIPAIDPVGTWSCVVYGHPAFGDERVLVRLAADGTAAVSRKSDGSERLWDPLSNWLVDDGQITFSDSRTGRQFNANLRRATLGGGWRTLTLVGGWWCTSLDDAAYASVLVRPPEELMPPLVPVRTAIPRYPLQAIRDAKQGRAATCFFVDAEGSIVQPEFIELSDEVFRAPTLTALERSQYRGWENAGMLRPGCRTFVFRLDMIRELAGTPPEVTAR